MIRIQDLTLDLQTIANSDRVRLLSISPLFEFENNKRTEKQIGYTLTVLEEKNFNKFTVKIETLKEIITNEEISSSKNPIYVTFKNFVGRFYFSQRSGQFELTCKSDAVEIISPTQSALKKD